MSNLKAKNSHTKNAIYVHAEEGQGGRAGRCIVTAAVGETDGVGHQEKKTMG